MIKEWCKRHPNVQATGMCKECGIAICDDCKTVRPEGIFCSEICAIRYGEHQQHIENLTAKQPERRPRPWLSGLIIALALISLLIYLHYSYGLDSPGDLSAALGQWLFDLASLIPGFQ